MASQGDSNRSVFSDCCSAIESWISWCSFCGRDQSYGQAFLDEHAEGRSASVTSSPCQAPVQATSSGLSSSERTSLLPKATELHPTGSRAGRQGDVPGGRPPKWVSLEEQKDTSSALKKEGKASLSSKGRNLSGLSLAASEEGEICSTCLEPYTEENPAIWTKCNHHFHLACIYEWLERKQTCPICERQMSFEEVLS